MRLSLKAGERIFINGAVLRSERRVTLELLNDATFLLEAHVMQLEDATTPLRQLYFIIQSMLINPAAGQETRDSVLSIIAQLRAIGGDDAIGNGLAEVPALLLDDRPFEALRVVRGLFAAEQAQTQPDGEGARVRAADIRGAAERETPAAISKVA